jgi:hypothetical protein
LVLQLDTTAGAGGDDESLLGCRAPTHGIVALITLGLVGFGLAVLVLPVLRLIRNGTARARPTFIE